MEKKVKKNKKTEKVVAGPVKNTVKLLYSLKKKNFKYFDVILYERFVKDEIAKLLIAELPKKPVMSTLYPIDILRLGKKYSYDVIITK